MIELYFLDLCGWVGPCSGQWIVLPPSLACITHVRPFRVVLFICHSIRQWLPITCVQEGRWCHHWAVSPSVSYWTCSFEQEIYRFLLQSIEIWRLLLQHNLYYPDWCITPSRKRLPRMAVITEELNVIIYGSSNQRRHEGKSSLWFDSYI